MADINKPTYNASTGKYAWNIDDVDVVVDRSNDVENNAPEETAGWDDLRFPLEATKKIASKEPVDTEYKGGVVLAFEDTADEGISFLAQTPHIRENGTDMRPHLHIALPTAGSGVGAENIKFDLTYSWAKIGYAFPTETTTSFTVDVQDYSADTHYLIEFDDDILFSNQANDGNDGVSSMLICSCFRDVSIANNYDDDVYVLELDFHYKIDQPRGSREETTK